MLPQYANVCLFLATRQATRRCTNKNSIEICWASLRRQIANMGDDDPMKQQLEAYMNINSELTHKVNSLQMHLAEMRQENVNLQSELFKWHENYAIIKKKILDIIQYNSTQFNQIVPLFMQEPVPEIRTSLSTNQPTCSNSNRVRTHHIYFEYCSYNVLY